MTARCRATTKSGALCCWPAGPRGVCLAHDPEQRDQLVARGRAGRAKQAAGLAASRRKPKLRCTDDLLAGLEHALALAEQSPGDKLQRAKAIAAVVAAAHTVLKADAIEVENRELRELLLEKHPELRKHLKSVP